MTDIFGLLRKYGASCFDHESDIAGECYSKLESRISAMQEVVGKAKSAIDPKMIKIHGGNCICSHCELIRAIDKLEALK